MAQSAITFLPWDGYSTAFRTTYKTLAMMQKVNTPPFNAVVQEFAILENLT
jgi:hypothetical protein